DSLTPLRCCRCDGNPALGTSFPHTAASEVTYETCALGRGACVRRYTRCSADPNQRRDRRRRPAPVREWHRRGWSSLFRAPATPLLPLPLSGVRRAPRGFLSASPPSRPPLGLGSESRRVGRGAAEQLAEERRHPDRRHHDELLEREEGAE